MFQQASFEMMSNCGLRL